MNVREEFLVRTGVLSLIIAPCLFACPSSDDDDSIDPSATPESSPTPLITPTPGPTSTDWVTHSLDLMEFWTTYNLDETYGGYYSSVKRDGRIGSRNKWTRSVSREVYGYVKTFQLTGDLTALEHAQLGVDFLLDYAYDIDHGGFYQELDETGANVLKNGREMFDLVYALTGLAAYVEVTHDPAVRAVVESMYGLLDVVAWDPNYGGYYKELSSDMTTVEDDGKDFNSLVDSATAYLFTLYAAIGQYGEDSALALAFKDRLRQIGFVISNKLINPDGEGTGWIGENFTADWEYDPDGGDFGDRTICGHNLKAVWTLERIHLITSESIFQTEAEDLFNFVMDYCRDRELGGIYDMVERQTNELVYGDQKAWWQQEQGMLAAQLLAAATGKSYYDRISTEVRDFYLAHFPDPTYGEVFFSVSGDGEILDDTKGSEWKSAYHSVETAYFSHLYDAFFVTFQPVTLYYFFEAAEVDRIVRLAPVAVPYGSYTIDDPALLDGAALALQTPSQLIVPAGSRGLLAVVYRPTGE